jgi:nicotinamide-nucleotide amidase
MFLFMRVELVAIGNELLLGQTVNTNSSWMAQELNLYGIQVSRISAIADSREDILNMLREAGDRSEVVILTGGLGPTSDDITKPVLCDFFETDLISDQGILEHIKSLLAIRGVELNDFNASQAEVPASAHILHNAIGTAPGLWFEKNGSIFISLPGVPFEMKALITDLVIPKLREKFTFPEVYYKTVITQGSFEAQLAEKLKNFESNLPANISFAYLPSPGIIRLRIGTAGADIKKLEMEVNKQVMKLQEIIPEYIVGFNNDTLELIIGSMLMVRSQSLSIAESCTGGAVSALVTSVPGSSAYFKGGIVAYSNEIKRDQLAIDRSLIDKYGAVSKLVVEDMAINTRLLFNTDYAVSVSGIAGPSGGSAEKPVGTTWIGVSCSNITLSEEFRFGDNRERNIQRASVAALNMLRKLIISQDMIIDSN